MLVEGSVEPCLLSESPINRHWLTLRARGVSCQKNVCHFCGHLSLRNGNIQAQRKRFTLGILLLLLFKYVVNRRSWTQSAIFPCIHTRDSVRQTAPGWQRPQARRGSCSSSRRGLWAAAQTTTTAGEDWILWSSITTAIRRCDSPACGLHTASSAPTCSPCFNTQASLMAILGTMLTSLWSALEGYEGGTITQPGAPLLSSHLQWVGFFSTGRAGSKRTCGHCHTLPDAAN